MPATACPLPWPASATGRFLRGGPSSADSSSAPLLGRRSGVLFVTARPSPCAFPANSAKTCGTGLPAARIIGTSPLANVRPSAPKRSSVTAVPLAPCLPVRPTRCTYWAGEGGGSKLTTTSNRCTSTPRAATSVASNIRSLPLRKSRSASSRSD
eukprot:scaffold61414_cov25-Tisochrysis_lutea.AAC.5